MKAKDLHRKSGREARKSKKTELRILIRSKFSNAASMKRTATDSWFVCESAQVWRIAALHQSTNYEVVSTHFSSVA